MMMMIIMLLMMTMLSRFTWVALILASMALFFYMIATKVDLVLSHERNVNIDIISDDTIRFPTVTICNQNPIRLNLCIINIFTLCTCISSSFFFFSF